MPKSLTLIWRLLRKHISIFELAIYFIANLIGMTVILVGVQIYSDMNKVMNGEEAIVGNDYVIVTCPVERVGVGNDSFTDSEIEDIKAQEFAKSVGVFTSSKFEVYASVDFNGQGVSTLLFFESVPEEFLDIESSKWRFDPNDKDRTIPIVIPRSYLNLYNFGFSQTQQLPQLTEDIIKRVEMSIRLRGNGRSDYFKAYIVGFSDRLNTILVPEQMMSWANELYGGSEQDNPTRLIIEVDNPSDAELLSYLDEHGLEIENKPSESSKAMSILEVSLMVIVFIGLAFSLLSIVILMLSIYLLLQKNITKLENLVLIGFTPSHVAMPYNILTLILNLSILLLSIVVVFIVQNIYMRYIALMTEQEISSLPVVAIITGIVLTTIVILFNYYIINRKIREISQKR